MVARTLAPVICRKSRNHSSDSGSTSTDQGASSPPSRIATGSSPRRTTFQRQRSARRAMYAGAGPTTATRPPRSVGQRAKAIGQGACLRFGGRRVGQSDRQLDQSPERRRPEPLAQGQLGVVEGRPVAGSPPPGSPGDRAGRSGRSPDPAASRDRPDRSPGRAAGTCARPRARRAGSARRRRRRRPTSVTDGMSRPFATRLVPTRTSSATVREGIDDALRGAAVLDDVAIQATHAERRESLADLALHALRATPQVADPR